MTTILLVDDHHAFRTVFGEVLRVKGYSVLEAGTIADVHHLVEHHAGAIDLLVVEAVLTTTNGVEVAHRVRVRYPKLHVLDTANQKNGSISSLPGRLSLATQ